MQLSLHPDFKIQKISFGNENAPLLVIDQFIDNAEKLVEDAVSKPFTVPSRFYPGIRAEAAPEYGVFLLEKLTDTLVDIFALPSHQLTFSMCHYSLVTTPPDKLKLIQRIPHVDSFDGAGLALVHYLFKAPYGGTAFYRHRKTGFESVNDARMTEYFGALENENGGPNIPTSGYINGDTALYERILAQAGAFNRTLIYRRNSLHSGSIDKNFVPDSNPLTGRLSVNCFIDVMK